MRVVGRTLLWFLSVGVAAYALVAYAFLPLGTTVEPGMRAGFAVHATGVYVHAFAASVALLLGPLQFSASFRRDHARIHRWLGRAYLGIGVLIGGFSALYLAQFAYGGPAARIGFGVLGLAWLYTGVRAFLAIRSGAVAEHRRWMTRNFALTFAAVMLRLYLPVAVAAGADFELAYAIIAWLCWAPNLLIAEWLFNGTQAPRPAT
ncbi:MAG: DUF2306 domain-containing protein [Lysobacterales bacterium]|nr:MAG: DUF2306 domain-containing protein [Xanthomonadales bacterium]